MADKTIELEPGHKRVIQRKPKPASGWVSDGSTTLEDEDAVSIPSLVGIPPEPPEPEPPFPEPEPPPVGALRGFGKTVKRNTTSLIVVTSLAQLRTAANGGRNAKVSVPVGTIWSLGGSDLNVGSNTAIDFGNLTLMHGAVRMQGASDVFLENLRSHAGDQYGNAQDLDALTINGNTAPVRRIYIRNSQFLWGPDVTVAMLGDIDEVTLERCVIAEGLSESKHPEAPHSLGTNVASQDPNQPAHRISFIECLGSTCQSRNFRLIGVGQAELIGCTIYNHNEGPQGSPTSAMLLGCTWKKGPIALANTFRFRAQDGGHGAFSAKPNTVYEHGGADVGFSGSGVDGKVKAANPLFQTTEPEPDAAMAHQLVLGGAGAFPADKQLTRLRANVRAGAGQYVNGFGKSGSYTGLV